MFPILFSLGPVTIYTFSVFVVLAFFSLGYVFWRKGKEEHYAEDELFDGFLLALFIGMVFSRIGFILLHFSLFHFQVEKWIDIFAFPGLVPFFGLVAGTWFLHTYSRKQKWNAFEILDFAAIAVAAGFALIWLGSFFAGTNIGLNTTLPWGMHFPNVFDKRHPTQIYGFVLYTLLFCYLSWAEGKYRTFEWYRANKHTAQTGFVFCMFCIAYGLIGILLAFLMPAEFVIGGYSLDIPIRFVIFLFGCLLLYTRAGRSLPLVKK